jgi:hypothetical protein
MATRTRKAVPSPTLAEALRFVDMRRVDPLVLRFPGDEAFKPTPLFAHLTLADHERKQLGFIFRLNSSSRDLTDDMVVRSSYAFFELRGDDVILQNILSVPIEWWNVIDAAGKVRYQVWIFAAADGGFVFDAGTTHAVGIFGQGTWFEPLDAPVKSLPGSHAAPANLAAQLNGARAVHGDREAVSRWLRSELAMAQFE